MILLLTILWPALLASLALGGSIGWHVGLPRRRTALTAAIGLASGALVLAGIALAGIVPGRPGFWVESAALNLTVYLIGTGLGALARMARPASERA
ncbi:hypothetical protein [Methylobacterium sp. 77]|uniref:hypothetical protein n=1 Tax=Methylobacterium sp. 77 TaxID=1101192 RepID=UPI00035F6B35|nr:hypothetical protein [Methylobacterium sp. 77]